MRPTEAHNPISANIDVQDASGIIEILKDVDAQIFTGWEDCESFQSEAVQNNITKFATSIASSIGMNSKYFREKNFIFFSRIFYFCIQITDSNDKVVLSGCGTSGRLAFFCSRQFNRVLCELNLPPIFDYLMAGGDEALFVSQELVEDDPAIGTIFKGLHSPSNHIL